MKSSTQKAGYKKWMYLIGLLAVCLFGLLWALAIMRTNNHNLVRESSQVRSLLTDTPGVPGRACGVLSELTAKELLDTKKLTGSFTNEPSENLVIIDGKNQSIHWSDICRYVDPTNSNKYIELFLETYSSADEAIADLSESLPKVGTVEDYANNKYDELFYSSGAWFARTDQLIIKVSANNGGPGDLKDYSEKVFKRLTAEL